MFGLGKKKQEKQNKKQLTYITPEGTVYQPYLDMVKHNHLLIAGSTGSGKSVTIHGIITSLLMTESPVRAQFLLLDPKRVELNCYEHLPHIVEYADTQNTMIGALEYAVEETERRFSIMKQNHEKYFSGSTLYVIIDEIADLMTTCKSKVLPLLQRLLQLSRAAGVRVIAASQTVHYTVLPTTLKCNFSVVLGLRTANANQSRYLVDCSGCELLPNPKKAGKAFGILRDGADAEKISLYMYPDAEISRIINHWTDKRRCIK